MEDRRLIEETFPVKEVSEESVKEKNIRHGHISTFHVWWARRPLASSRGIGFSSLVKAPSQNEEVARLKEFTVKLSKWENSLNTLILHQAKKIIFDSGYVRPPKILDPFAGGGSIPLEALRLGCETYASDYNPVSTLILKCTLEFPQKYTDNRSSFDLELVSKKNKLMDDIKKWDEWILREVEKEVKQFYPLEKDGSIPVAYIWARTVHCQNPLCKAEIPLMKQYWLANKHERKISLYPYTNDEIKEVKFKIVGSGYESFPVEFNPEKGTVSRAVVVCPVCGSTLDNDTTRRLFQEGKASERMILVVSHKKGQKGKKYRIATNDDVKVYYDAKDSLEKKRRKLTEKWGVDPVPDEPITRVPVSFGVINVWLYGMLKWGDLFNLRQQLIMITLVEKVREAYQELLKEGANEEYAKAIATYLGLSIDMFASFSNRLARWENTSEAIKQLFSRQALPMLWDYAEVNPFSSSSGSLENGWEYYLKVIDHCSQASPTPATVRQSSAVSLHFPDNFFDAIITDPPYYDNVPYSYLSDFYYVWLKRSIGHLYPELFATPLTPKTDEIVAYSNTYGGLDGGKRFFESMLSKAFSEIRRTLKPGGITVIVYAHKSNAGWETLINSLLDSGLVVTGAWPIHTEMKERLRARESAVLASSIYMVARKLERLEVGFYSDVKGELKDFLNVKLDKIWSEGISGADFFISAIGSSTEVIGKYQKVIDDGGDQIRADKLLDDVRRIVTDYAVKQVLHNGFAAEIKPITRFYVLWRWAYGNSILVYDEARKLGQSVGIDVSQEWNRGFISKKKEFIEVLGPEDRESDRLEDSTELIDVLHRVLLLWKRGRYEEITKILSETGYGKSDVFYRVAQAISESLANGNEEKKLLEGFLVGKERIAKEVRKEVAQRRLFE